MATRPYVCHFYRDLTGEWRFRVVASNGRIVAESGEGYHNRKDCEKDFKKLQTLMPTAISLTDEPVCCDK